MEITIPDKEDLEKSIGLMLEARRRSTLKRWIALADCYYDMSFEGEDEEEDAEEDLGRNILHALVELSWWGWKRDADLCLAGLRIGQEGNDTNGIPPFLNIRIGFAHMELAVMFDQVGNLALSEDGQALGLLLLAFHMTEAFVRPGMVMATFLLRVLTGEKVTIGEVLREKGGRGRIKSYSAVRNKFVKAIKDAKMELGSLGYLNVLDGFMAPDRKARGDVSKVDLNLLAVRDAIAHHDFDIYEGEVRLRWVYHARGGRPGHKDTMSVEELDENLRYLRGLVIVFFAWENMMIATCLPEEYPEDLKATTMAEGLIGSLETMRRVAWPFIR